MARLNGLQHSRYNQVVAAVLGLAVLVVLVLFVAKGAQWWAITVAAFLLVMCLVGFFFAGRSEQSPGKPVP